MTTKIITSSESRAWKSCRKRWWFRYDQCQVPIKPQVPLSFGSLAHEGLEAYYLGKPIEDALRAYLADNDLPWNSDEVQFVYETAYSMLLLYAAHDPVRAMGHTVVGTEEEFLVPLRTPGGRRWNSLLLAGKKDLRTRDRHGNLWIWDHKTGSAALKPDWLQIDDQMAFYLWAESQGEEVPVGIVYNQLRKPVIKPRKNESPEEWGKRLRVDIASRPKFYYQHELIVKNRQDLARIESDLWELAHNIGSDPIYRNPSNCNIMGCAYMELCRNDTEMVRKAAYRYERPHIELMEVV